MACPDENELCDYAGRRLAAERSVALERHLAGCAACREVLAEVLRGSAGRVAGAPPQLPLGEGARVSRYLVLEQLGEGSMGAVYAAYDPQLDRRVALKLLHADLPGEAGAAARARLLREATTIARLAHPNVVAVYDCGEASGEVFIAMELVPGTTLHKHLEDAKPGWREVVELFLQAGRGLWAAHQAGVVHRDFKPANVLLGADGRVRVADFGCAHSASEPAPRVPAEARADPVDSRLTRTGALIGTPAFMAPEQLRGGKPDERSDQFSFAVAFYEALYRERPFAGDTLRELAESAEAGLIRRPPPGARAPQWLRRLLARALAARPDDRFATMGALLAELEAGARRRRVWLAAGAMVIFLSLLGFAALRSGSRALCPGGEERLAGVWDAASSARVKGALFAALPGSAGEAWRKLEAALSAYARGWAAMRREACVATRVRGEQSEALLDLRMQCLEDRHRALSALVSVLSQERASAAGAVDAAHALPSLSGCADARALLARGAPPPPPEKAAAIDRVSRQIAEANALTATGVLNKAVATAAAAEKAAAELGYRPLQAAALCALGTAHTHHFSLNEADPALHRATALALQIGDDATAARALTELVYVQVKRGEAESALDRVGPLAEAELQRAGGDAAIELRLRRFLCLAALNLERLPAARVQAERAVAVAREARDQGPLAASALHSLANVLHAEGKSRDALAAEEEGLRLRRALYGEHHLETAFGYAEVAQRRSFAGAHAEALAAAQRATAIVEELAGADSPQLGNPLLAQSEALRQLGRAAEAEPIDRRVLRLAEQNASMASLHADAERALGEDLLALARPADALPHLEQATALYSAKTGGDPLDLFQARFGLAQALWKAGGDRERAAKLAREVLAGYRSRARPEEDARRAAVEAFLAAASTHPHIAR